MSSDQPVPPARPAPANPDSPPPPAKPHRPGPEKILALVDEQAALAAEAKEHKHAEHARCNRLYEACRLVEVYDDARYEAEHGKPPPSDQQFCLAWAAHVLTLARVLDEDGWWKGVVKALASDAQAAYVLAILTVAKGGDRGGTAWLLEEGYKRRSAMAGAGGWLRGYLYDELLGTERFRTARLQPTGAPATEAADRGEDERVEPTLEQPEVPPEVNKAPSIEDKVGRAIAIKLRHPGWTAVKIAGLVGCTAANLSQSKRWQTVCAAARDTGRKDCRREGHDRRGKSRGGKHRGHDMDKYADNAGERLTAGPAAGPKCASKGCGDPAGKDLDGNLLLHEGKPRCRECWEELTDR